MILMSAFCLWAQLAQEPGPTPQRAIQEAKAAWAKEGGRIWGRSLAGPLLIVDPETRRVWASEPDGGGLFKSEGGAYTGLFPENALTANTVTKWDGKDWIMLVLPLPNDEKQRTVLYVHEAWHRVQADLGLPMRDSFNAHMDTLDGRYWLQLELRALANALGASKDGKERQSWVAAALACRQRRRQLFPQAAEAERLLELGEGLAEYTGLRAAGAKEYLDERIKSAAKPFARSFAYYSGPAYGLLLDDKQPGWTSKVNQGTDISALAQKAYKIAAPTKADAENAASRLGGAELWAREEEAELQKKQLIAKITKTFVDGSVLIIPKGFGIQFNPSNTENIEGVGVYHPTATYMGEWGRLEASQGSLRRQDWSEARVASPTDPKARPVLGPGWKLDLAPGWCLEAIGDNGSFKIAKESY